MRPALQLRISQQLAVTPQLQQSVKLLQMSSLELQQELQILLEQNPFLELDEEPAELELEEQQAAHESSSEAASMEAASEADFAATQPQALQADDLRDPNNQEDFEHETDQDWTVAASTNKASHDNDDFEAQQAAPVSLLEHLRWQLSQHALSPAQQMALEIVVKNLDERGYLTDELESLQNFFAEQLSQAEAAEQVVVEMPVEGILEQAHELLRWALRLVQSLEPAGIGARDLTECLTLQVKRWPAAAVRTQALALLQNHWVMEAQQKPEWVAKRLGINPNEVSAALHSLKRCDPRPAAAFANPQQQYLQPDVLVRKGRHGWEVMLNAQAFPGLRVNQQLSQQLPRRDRRCEQLRDLAGQARQVVKSLQLRGQTVLRVAKLIVERQSEFLEHGNAALKPLLMMEIAEQLGLHPSTVSRVNSNKYLQTPRGIFAFKDFFSTSIPSQGNSQTSVTSIKEQLKKWLSQEDPAHPLSDDALAQRFQQKGIQLARRTVTKYREALGLGTSSARKRR